MDPFIGEIRVFAGNFAPKEWAFCNGQILSIQQNAALYSIIGVRYGGDGKTTFALPNLQERIPIHQGNGAGLTPRPLATKGGENLVTLTVGQLPAHRHTPHAQKTIAADALTPEQNVWSVTTPGRTSQAIYASNSDVQMKADALVAIGGSQPHNNMQPYLVINYIIALTGVYPQRP